MPPVAPAELCALTIITPDRTHSDSLIVLDSIRPRESIVSNAGTHVTYDGVSQKSFEEIYKERQKNKHKECIQIFKVASQNEFTWSAYDEGNRRD